jgi:large repetitive protein
MRAGFPGIAIVLLALFQESSSATLSGQSIGAVLTISKSAPAFVISGQNLTYTLTYGNTGSSNATGVVISDSLPAGTSFVSVTGGGSLSLGSCCGT